MWSNWYFHIKLYKYFGKQFGSFLENLNGQQQFHTQVFIHNKDTYTKKDSYKYVHFIFIQNIQTLERNQICKQIMVSMDYLSAIKS